MSATQFPESAVRVAHYLFDGALEDSIATEVLQWLAGSARFRAFAEANRDKIRKKLRGAAADPEARRDVRAELRIAQLLLSDRRVELEFEAYGSGNRGPDFTAARGGDRFNLEVTRPRGRPEAAGFSALLAKLRQLPPAAPNAVLLAVEGEDARAYDSAAAIRALRARADAKDEALFTARGFTGSREFYDRFLRLGCVIAWAEAGQGESRATAWTNASARIAFPRRVLAGCLTALREAQAG
jgi:hypothetical protein